MSVLSSGEIICCEQKFKARDILPVLKENDRRPTALFVNLLRNRNGEYGYTALSFGKNCESLSAGYSRFIYELSIILERFGNMPYHNLMGETGTGTVSLFPPLLSLIHISEPTRLLSISYAVFCLKKKKKQQP